MFNMIGLTRGDVTDHVIGHNLSKRYINNISQKANNSHDLKNRMIICKKIF